MISTAPNQRKKHAGSKGPESNIQLIWGFFQIKKNKTKKKNASVDTFGSFDGEHT